MYFNVLDTIESSEPIPEQYPSWKDVLDDYTKEKKGELDTYTTEIQTDLKAYKKDLEDEMLTTKDTLAGEITATATEKTNEFNTNAETKTNTFNDNVTEKTTNYNTNAETKLKAYNDNASSKSKEYNDNSTTKLEEYNTNATNKVAEFNNNVDIIDNELTELASQMPWNTTEVAESIHIEDSAKYSRNKLDVFGNLNQNTREGYNKLNVLEENSAGTTKTVNEVTYTFNEDGTISLNGTATSNVYIPLNTKLNIANGGSILTKILKGTVTGNITLAIYDENLENSISNTLVSKETSILSKDIVYCKCRLVVFKDAVVNNLVLGNMILDNTVKQSKTEIEYEQYGAMPSIDYPSMPVVATGVQKITKCKKNFWKFECAKLKPSSQTWFFFNGNGGAWGTNIQNKTKSYIKLKKGFYAFSYIKANNCNLQIIDNNEKILINSVFPKTIELKEDTYIIPRFRNIENNVETYVEGLQIEKVSSLSDTATTYEPYTEEIFTLDLADTELCKITDTNGNVVAQDRAVYREVDGVKKWQWEKYILKAVMNSKSEFTYNGLKNNTTVDFTSPVFKNLPTNVYSPNIEETTRYNYLKPNSITATNKFRISVSLADLGLEEFTTHAVAVQALKDLIAKKGDAIIYYKATEPIYEDCTPSQSEVLDKLHKISLEKGVNNIFVESENGVTTELQLTYMQDLQSKLNQLEAMIVSNASEEV